MATPKSAPDIDIREMRIDDIPIVFHLGEAVFTADDSPTLYRTWDEYEVVSLFSSDGETCLVAEIDDEVVGFTLGTIINKRKSAWSYGYLIWIAVDPDRAGLGIGRELVEALTEVFIENGARMLLVDTDAEKSDALAFFERMGFGNPVEHVYLSKNLIHDPEYHRIRARQKGHR